jgi:Zn-dependent peptidase ImmA (M78 family)
MSSKPDVRKTIYRAKEILRQLHIKKPEHILEDLIAANRGVLVKEEYISGAAGKLATFGNKGLITVNSNIDIPGKKRFIIAHELGHFELHRDNIININCIDDDFKRWYKGNSLEIEANFFAAELLMPEDLYYPKIKGKDVSKELIELLAREFNTSITATAIRFVTLRPDYALICSDNSEIKWYVVNFDQFPYPLNATGKVHKNSMAYEFFMGNSLSDTLFPVEKDAWFRWSVQGKLKELAISLGKKYNQVLSFLYVEEEWD